MKAIPQGIKDNVKEVVETSLEADKEIEVGNIRYLLEKVYGIRFYNLKILQELIEKALDEIVYVYVGGNVND
ncbi:hypothetical protein ACQPU1_01445 [Clostridium paraputrificum]|uniref:hypothetical protein n=1 Tax=Clostridium paraputrificum TaxID=29363 RepID=UPI003D3373A5